MFSLITVDNPSGVQTAEITKKEHPCPGVFLPKLYDQAPKQGTQYFWYDTQYKQNRIREQKMRILTVDNLSYNLDKLSETVSEDMVRFRQQQSKE